MTVNMNTTTSISNETSFECPREEPSFYPSVFGISLVVPPLEAIGTAIALSMIIVLTIVGNILVILSVFTYKPLRIVQNFFIVSLAVGEINTLLNNMFEQYLKRINLIHIFHSWFNSSNSSSTIECSLLITGKMAFWEAHVQIMVDFRCALLHCLDIKFVCHCPGQILGHHRPHQLCTKANSRKSAVPHYGCLGSVTTHKFSTFDRLEWLARWIHKWHSLPIDI